MSRTFEQIRTEIVVKKTELLPQLNSSSQTSIWWLWVNIMATAIFTFEQIFYTEKALLERETELKRYGSVNWYAIKCLEFQNGDPLVFDSETGLFGYAVIDPSKKIIKRAAVNESIDDRELLIKVAKENVSGDLIPLTAPEVVLLTSYINEIRVAGVDFQVLSLPSDIVDGVADVYYDGNYSLNDVQTAINDVLNTFKKEFSFNGVLLKNKLIDVIQSVAGVDDILFTSLTGQNGASPAVNIVRDYATVSGYFNYQANWVSNWNFIPRYENPTA